jgi:hypothetical protein
MSYQYARVYVELPQDKNAKNDTVNDVSSEIEQNDIQDEYTVRF